MKMIDLHTHSIYSDGSMTPAELVRHAKAEGLCAVALSDHDSLSGVAEAMAEGERIGIEVIPAIELSAESDTETHILGYFIGTNAYVFNAGYTIQAMLSCLTYALCLYRTKVTFSKVNFCQRSVTT